MSKTTIFFIAILVILSMNLFSQSNPFFDSKTRDVKESIFTKSRIFQTIILWQKEFRSRITSLFKNIHKNKKNVLLLMAFSFVYGTVHALGPGHRKIVIASYFLSNRDSKISHGIFSGFFLSILHTGSAILIISILYFIVKKSINVNTVVLEKILEKISYTSLLLLGVILTVIKIVVSKNKPGSHKKNSQTKSLLPLLISSGIVPCPGASMILIFSLSQKSFGLGIVSVLMMSLGMGVTISTVAILVMLSKKTIVGNKNSVLKNWIHDFLEYAGYFILIIFTLIMVLPLYF